MTVSAIFDPNRWNVVEGFSFTDITYHRAKDQGTVRIAFNRPEVRNAFRPETVQEMQDAFERCRNDSSIGVIILTGEGAHAFCSGGDQRVRGEEGYLGQDGILDQARGLLNRCLLLQPAV